MIWEALIRSYRDSKKKRMFLHVGIQGYFMSWTLNGDSILNIQRLEGRERVFSGKERSTSKGTKARWAKKSWGSVWWEEERRQEGWGKSRGCRYSEPHKIFWMLFIRKRRTTDVSAEVLRYCTGRGWQLIRCWEWGGDEGERWVNGNIVIRSAHDKFRIPSTSHSFQVQHNSMQV